MRATLDTATWRKLSRSPSRHKALALNLYFRDCWEDALAILGSSAAETLRGYALLIFKPESVVGRRITPALDWLMEHHFSPVAFAPVTHTRHTMINLWKYSRWTPAMPDWIQLAGLMHTSTDTLLVILRDEEQEVDRDACARLVRLKGSAISQQRNRSHLREALRPPSEIFNFVHSSDEPADLVREVGICLDRPHRRQLLQTLITYEKNRHLVSKLGAEVARLEAASAEHDFDFKRSLQRIQNTWPLDPDARWRLEKANNGGPKLSWDELKGIVDLDAVEDWDFISIACAVLDL